MLRVKMAVYVLPMALGIALRDSMMIGHWKMLNLPVKTFVTVQVQMTFKRIGLEEVV
jgi:hypothetical protein